MVVHNSPQRPSWVRLFGVTLSVTIGFAAFAVVVAVLNDLPVRDPDGLFGPSWVRLPLIVSAMVAVDVVPRVVMAVRGGGLVREVAPRVLAQRWPMSRLAVVAAGLSSFYLAYVAYRNLKSFLPFVRQTLTDRWLVESDMWLTGGRHPGDFLHELLGTGAAAEGLSSTYIFFLFFVPFSLALALVWSDDLARGAWYVNALCFNWILGTASYYVLPSLGPIYVERFRFEDLPATEVSGLQRSLLNNRVDVLADPHATQAVHGIAAFASLHVSIVFTAALVAHLVRLPLVLRVALWTFTALTVLATVYFGWHYLLDVVAGFGIGALSVWIGAWAIRGAAPRPPVDDRREDLQPVGAGAA
jgi:membrane-associated phospholipid phosphatase